MQTLAMHQQQWQYIQNALQGNHLPQAMLLVGEKGLGKAAFAKQLAQYFLCEAPVNNHACGHCAACLQFISGNHPDYYCLELSEKIKSIGIDDIRQLSTQLQQSSHQQGKRVVIFNPISALTVSASHALLKTLEEPLGDVVMLAVLSYPQEILPTLTSRLIPLPFFNDQNDSFSQLNDIDKTYKNILSALYAESPLMVNEQTLSNIKLLADEVLNHVGKSLVPKISALEIPATWYKDNALLVMQLIFLLVRDAIQLQAHGALEKCVYYYVPEKIKYIAKKLNLAQWFEVLDKIYAAMADIQHATAFNNQYIIENVLLSLQKYSLS